MKTTLFIGFLVIGSIVAFELSKIYLNEDECRELGFNYDFCMKNYPYR